MKSILAVTGALILGAVLTNQALAHPEAYGPDGLIPHSHSDGGVVVSGSSAAAAPTDACPVVPQVQPTAPAVRPVSGCVRIINGRPSGHSGLTVNRNLYAAPRVIMQQPVIQQVNMVQPVVRHVPVVRNVVQNVQVVRPVVHHVPVVTHQPVVRHVQVQQPVIRQVAYAPQPVVQPVRHVHPAPVVAVPKLFHQARNAELVTQFNYQGEVLDVWNTHSNVLGMSLIKIVTANGTHRAAWWTGKGQCFTAPAYLHQACWSRASYQARFAKHIDGPSFGPAGHGKGPIRDNDPCAHYSKLEATISQDTSGRCGY